MPPGRRTPDEHRPICRHETRRRTHREGRRYRRAAPRLSTRSSAPAAPPCAGRARRRVGPPPTRRAAGEQRRQRTAAEVQTVNLDIAGTACCERCRDQGAHAVDLPDCGPPTTATLPVAPASWANNNVAALLEGAVHEADRHSARDVAADPCNRRVEFGRRRQRWQPHLMGRGPATAEPIDDCFEAWSAMTRARVELHRSLVNADAAHWHRCEHLRHRAGTADAAGYERPLTVRRRRLF